jgi:putative hydrolase of the HAD superfamily
VLFDLFHTLVRVPPAPDTGTYTWDELGVSQSDWQRVLFADRPGRGIGRVRDPVEGFRLLAHEIDPTIPMERIERAALRRVARFDRTLETPEPAVVDALSRLRAHGVKIALVSNAGFDEIGAWPRSPLAPHFDATIFSCEVGAAKPDRAIYEHALRGVGVAAADAVFVGDGGSDEHRGARAVGLQPVIVTRYASTLWPEKIAELRPHADHAFEDVAAFADHVVAGGRP